MSKFKRRIFNIIEIGNRDDLVSSGFDIFIVAMIIINLTVTLLYTFDEMAPYQDILQVLDRITVIVFTIEYILRLWTAEYLYPDKKKGVAVLRFIVSFYGIIDLMTFLPYYLPIVFPAGIVAFRILRVFRIFKLFKVNAQVDAYNIITNVLKEKSNQILSSCSLILIIMVASSLIMYSLEHEAQPQVFRNAFSGMWWAVSALLTVGYGDIYPITFWGRAIAIVISFLGVGLVAIPTGIISAGFVEYYDRIKVESSRKLKREYRSLVINVSEDSELIGRSAYDVAEEMGLTLVVLQRDREMIVPSDDTVIVPGDELVLTGRQQCLN